MTCLSVRPDREQVLPSGYVSAVAQKPAAGGAGGGSAHTSTAGVSHKE